MRKYYLAIGSGASSGLSIDTWGVDYVLLRGEAPVLPWMLCGTNKIGVLTAHLPRVNTITNEQLKLQAEAFKVDYRKESLAD